MPLTDDQKTAICDVITCTERAALPKPDKPDLPPIGWAIANWPLDPNDVDSHGNRDYWFCRKHPEIQRDLAP